MLIEPSPHIILLRHEIALHWRFIGRDASTTIIPGLLFVVAAWIHTATSLSALALVFTHALIYFWSYVATFCLSNQIVGVTEDRINKPDRPLVAGLVSQQGAWVRWAIYMMLFPALGWWFGVLPWAILWQVVILLHNFGGWGQRWLTKHLAMSLGTLAQLAAAWQLVAPITSSAWRWIGLISLLVFPLVAVQDLRDMAGDRAIGRTTMPIVFGEQLTRIVICIGFVLAPLAVHALLLAPLGLSSRLLVCDVLLALLSFTIAWRVMRMRYRWADHQTYMLFTYWYCALLASAIVAFAV